MAPKSASVVSARMESLSRPLEFASPLPSKIKAPNPISRAISANPKRDTMEARILEISDSGRVGYFSYKRAAIDKPNTASPKNSRRSLLGRCPFSLAKERCVNASRRYSSSRSTSRLANSGAVSIAAKACSSACSPLIFFFRLTKNSPARTSEDLLALLPRQILQPQRRQELRYRSHFHTSGRMVKPFRLHQLLFGAGRFPRLLPMGRPHPLQL